MQPSKRLVGFAVLPVAGVTAGKKPQNMIYLVPQAGRRPDLQARLRARLGVHRIGLGDWQEDNRRADLAGSERGRDHTGHYVVPAGGELGSGSRSTPRR